MEPIVTHAEVASRLDRLRDQAAARGAHGVVVLARSFYDRPGNVAYFANHFPPFPAGMYWGDMRGIGHSALVAPIHGDPVLLVDTTARRDMVPYPDIRHARAPEAPEGAFLPDFAAAIAGVLEEKGIAGGAVGLVGEDTMPVRMDRDLRERVPALRWISMDEDAARQRAVKSPAEVEMLRRAAGACGAGYEATLAAVRDGATEREICAVAMAATMRAGADFVRYARTYGGPHSAWGVRWPQATDRALRDGEMLVLDIVGAREGAQFDVNRTTVVGRRPSDAQRRQLDAALAATRAAIDACRPGAMAADVVAAANRVLEARGFGSAARPFIGHGIGLETMEPPLLYPTETTPLAPGMVLCVEPGIEIPGGEGVRIEEEVVVTEGAPEVITQFDPELWS